VELAGLEPGTSSAIRRRRDPWTSAGPHVGTHRVPRVRGPAQVAHYSRSARPQLERPLAPSGNCPSDGLPAANRESPQPHRQLSEPRPVCRSRQQVDFLLLRNERRAVAGLSTVEPADSNCSPPRPKRQQGHAAHTWTTWSRSAKSLTRGRRRHGSSARAAASLLADQVLQTDLRSPQVARGSITGIRRVRSRSRVCVKGAAYWSASPAYGSGDLTPPGNGGPWACSTGTHLRKPAGEAP